MDDKWLYLSFRHPTMLFVPDADLQNAEQQSGRICQPTCSGRMFQLVKGSKVQARWNCSHIKLGYARLLDRLCDVKTPV